MTSPKPHLPLPRFRALVEAYGTHFERWPEAERAGARELVLASREARALLDGEAGLDAWLDAAAPPALPTDLEARLLSLPKRARPLSPFRARALRLPALACAAAAAFGLWLGTQSSTQEEDALLSADSAQSASMTEDDQQLLALTGGALDDWSEAP